MPKQGSSCTLGASASTWSCFVALVACLMCISSSKTHTHVCGVVCGAAAAGIKSARLGLNCVGGSAATAVAKVLR
jgi:hypothetical protein